jgi:hypothetical protein
LWGGRGGGYNQECKNENFGKLRENLQMNKHSDENRLEVSKQSCSPLQIFDNEFLK